MQIVSVESVLVDPVVSEGAPLLKFGCGAEVLE